MDSLSARNRHLSKIKGIYSTFAGIEAGRVDLT